MSCHSHPFSLTLLTQRLKRLIVVQAFNRLLFLAGRRADLYLLQDPTILSRLGPHVKELELLMTDHSFNAQQLAAICELSNLRRLRLISHYPFSNSFEAIPDHISKLCSLQQLVLEESPSSRGGAASSIIAVSREVSQLSHMTYLRLASAAACMGSVCMLASLQVLRFQRMAGVSCLTQQGMANLSRLTSLHFSDSCIGGSLHAVSGLIALQALHLHNVQLAQAAGPHAAFISGIGQLTNLRVLDMVSCEIAFNESALSRLYCLTRLELNHMRLLTFSCQSWPSLKELRLARNHFSALPSNLTALSAVTALDLSEQIESNYQIREPMDFLACMPHLHRLWLQQGDDLCSAVAGALSDDEDEDVKNEDVEGHQWSPASLCHLVSGPETFRYSNCNAHISY